MDLTALQNPWVWVATVIAVAIVIVYAMTRKKGSLQLKVGGLEANVDQNVPGADRGVSVANQIKVTGEAGNITGVRGAAAAGVNRPVEVAKGARIQGKVGDITGVDASGGGAS